MYLLLRHWLLGQPPAGESRGGWPSGITERLARFAIRVSRELGSCSAVRLKCVSRIPINTTPNKSIVQVMRDRIRFPFATDRRAENSHVQLKDRTTECKLLKNFAGSDSERVANSALTLAQR